MVCGAIFLVIGLEPSTGVYTKTCIGYGAIAIGSSWYLRKLSLKKDKSSNDWALALLLVMVITFSLWTLYRTHYSINKSSYDAADRDMEIYRQHQSNQK